MLRARKEEKKGRMDEEQRESYKKRRSFRRKYLYTHFTFTKSRTHNLVLTTFDHCTRLPSYAEIGPHPGDQDQEQPRASQENAGKMNLPLCHIKRTIHTQQNKINNKGH